MEELLQLVGLVAIVFGLSMAISYAMSASKRKRQSNLSLPENTSVRLVGPGGVYRSYFLRKSSKGLVFSAPLQRDNYVPVRPDECLMVQVPVEGSIITFRASVRNRDKDTHEITLNFPERVRQVDRRSEPRDRSLEGSEIALNSQTATLVDLSAYGAKVITLDDIKPGDTIRLDLPNDYGQAYGWALESSAVASNGRQARAVRIRFDTPLSGMKSKQRRHLYLGH